VYRALINDVCGIFNSTAKTKNLDYTSLQLLTMA
jgi:hypothetical protein